MRGQTSEEHEEGEESLSEGKTRGAKRGRSVYRGEQGRKISK